jgi:hypothetical protein
MAQEWTEGFYTSRRWRKCRKAFVAYRISVDGGLCQMCQQEQGYIVHHKIEITPENINDPDITMGTGNLMYLCHDCHNKIHGIEPPRYRFNSNGDVLPPIKL